MTPATTPTAAPSPASIDHNGATRVADATLIIVTYNSSEFFTRLNDAIARQTWRPAEVIVVDSGSSETNRPTFDTLPVATRIIQVEENIGFAAANNLAAASAQTTFLALLNPDAFPEPAWLEKLMARAVAHPQCAAFGSTQLSGSMHGRYDGLGDEYHVSGLAWRAGYGLPFGAIEVRDRTTFSPCAAAALYRSAVWREVGGFEEAFFCYCEDVDLGFRIRLQGWQITQVADAVVTHIGGASAGVRSAFSVYYGTRNRIWVYFRNYPILALMAFLPMHIAANVAFLAASFGRGTGIPTMKGIVDAIGGLPKVLRQRRQIRRLVSSWSMLQWMIWSPIPILTRRPPMRSRPRVDDESSGPTNSHAS